MKNKTFNNLFGITVSKNYSDELSVMLENNAKFFDAWYIVSQEDDEKTTELILSKNLNNVHLIYYPLCEKTSKPEHQKSLLSGDDLKISIAPYASEEKKKYYESLDYPTFDKGGGILTAQKYYLPKLNPTSDDLFILMDSDVILPEDFLLKLQNQIFEEDTLYGPTRSDFLFYSDFLEQKNFRPFKQMGVAGFLQISKYYPSKLCKRVMDCDWVDNEYKNQFANNKLLKNIKASHLGLCGMNWEGIEPR